MLLFEALKETEKVPVISTMLGVESIRFLLLKLAETIQVRVPGAVVELGCNVGTATVKLATFIQSLDPAFRELLDHHVYDTFEGIPYFDKEDVPPEGEKPIGIGTCKSAEETLRENLKKYDLQWVHIHRGLIAGAEFPPAIRFAFLDMDVYRSIKEGLGIVYPRLSPGGVICVHDYGYARAPGVRKAVDPFLNDKDLMPFKLKNMIVLTKPRRE